MDPGFYEDLAGRLYGLLIGLEDRLNSDDAAIIHQFIDARHYGLALEEIARTWRTARSPSRTGNVPACSRWPARSTRWPWRPGAAEGRSRAGVAGAWITRITRTSRAGCTAW